MHFMTQISEMFIPAILVLVVCYGLFSRVKVYEAFLKGAKEGLKITVEMVPTLIGLLVAVGVLRASGFFEVLGTFFAPFTDRIGLPSPILPLLLTKMFSASASTGLLLDIFKTYGPDSGVGLIASIMMSCTETIFFTMSVYFLAAKITKTRYTLKGALLSTTAGAIASILIVRI